VLDRRPPDSGSVARAGTDPVYNGCMSHSADYETDILEWSEHQASALRELARKRPDLSNVIDWENVAEEIESVGRSEFNAVRSHIRQILIHLIKALSVPDSVSMAHWRREDRAFHANLLDHLSPSMVARVDLAQLWRRARREAALDLTDSGLSVWPHLPDECPLTVAELVDPAFNFTDAVEMARRSTDIQNR
jgi:hypothetical protein